MLCCGCSFQSAAGWDYHSDLSKHESQTDASKGFGGKFGVDTERQDKVQSLNNLVLFYS